MLVFAIHQHDSAIGIHMSPPSESSPHLPPHPTPLGCHRASDFSFLHRRADFHLVPNFIYGNVCFNAVLTTGPILSFP